MKTEQEIFDECIEKHKKNNPLFNLMLNYFGEKYNSARPDCLAIDRIFDYVNGKTSETETIQMDEHFDKCPYCLYDKIKLSQHKPPDDYDWTPNENFQKEMKEMFINEMLKNVRNGLHKDQ